MNKNKKKVIVGLIIFILCILFIGIQVQAVDFNPDDYEPSSISSVSGATKLGNIGNDIIGVIQVIGSISSVIALILIGIKYVMGSVEEKAEYKQTLKPYLIGAIMVFGITNLLGIIQSIVIGFYS